MHTTMNDPVDWFALGAWFQGADGAMAELATAAALAQTLVGGTPEANVATARDLDGCTRRVAAWLAAEPCPEVWVGDFVGAVIEVLGELADCTLRTDGCGPTTDERFPARVVRACLMTPELRSIAGRLHVYAGFDSPGP